MSQSFFLHNVCGKLFPDDLIFKKHSIFFLIMKTFGSGFLSRLVFYTLKYKKDGDQNPMGPCYNMLFQVHVFSEISKSSIWSFKSWNLNLCIQMIAEKQRSTVSISKLVSWQNSLNVLYIGIHHKKCYFFVYLFT